MYFIWELSPFGAWGIKDVKELRLNVSSKGS